MICFQSNRTFILLVSKKVFRHPTKRESDGTRKYERKYEHPLLDCRGNIHDVRLSDIQIPAESPNAKYLGNNLNDQVEKVCGDDVVDLVFKYDPLDHNTQTRKCADSHQVEAKIGDQNFFPGISKFFAFHHLHSARSDEIRDVVDFQT